MLSFPKSICCGVKQEYTLDTVSIRKREKYLFIKCVPVRDHFCLGLKLGLKF